MIKQDLLMQTWKDFGLKEDEFNQLGPNLALNYLRYHYNRNEMHEDSPGPRY